MWRNKYSLGGLSFYMQQYWVDRYVYRWITGKTAKQKAQSLPANVRVQLGLGKSRVPVIRGQAIHQELVSDSPGSGEATHIATPPRPATLRFYQPSYTACPHPLHSEVAN